MPLAVDLMGLGLAPEQATYLGSNSLTTQAGVGTAQVGAAAIVSNNILATTAVGQTAFVLPASAPLEVPYIVTNSTATAALVFPPSGGTINAGAADASASIAQNLARIFIRKSATRWVSFLTA